tara:strand:- start:1869 stop:2297 length:429 start_codon:yes stop_codon:yes gene_type:complete
MKKILITVTLLVVFGALIWHQLPTDENNNIVIKDIVEAEEPVLPPSSAFPDIDLDRHIVRPFDEQFAIAREELGPDGLFEWQGREYHCLYKEELEELIIKAIEDSISTHNNSIQIVETVLPVEVIEDSTLIQSEAKFEDFTP